MRYQLIENPMRSALRALGNLDCSQPSIFRIFSIDERVMRTAR